jgi:hypothetical protein
VVRTADDDGSNSAQISANDVVALVQKANEVFAAAEVEFIYDPAKDFTHINSTLLNQTSTPLEILEKATDPAKEPRMSDVPNSRARMRLTENFPDRLVVYFSQKTKWSFDATKGHWVLTAGTTHSSSGLGWYVGMLSTASGTVLAHELGHFLQNRHTFGGQPKDVAAAASAIREYVDTDGHPKNDGAKVFDGDAVWVTDTPPDPGGTLFQSVTGDKCGTQGAVDVPVTFADATKKTYSLQPDRTNFMSYFRCTNLGNPVRMSTQQAWRVKDTVETGFRNRLIAAKGAALSGLLTRKDSGSAGAVSSTAIVATGGGRVVTPVRNGSGDLEVVVWDLGLDGANVHRRGSASGGAVTDIAACYCGLGLVATAAKTAGDTLKVILWKVDAAGNITRMGDESAGQIGTGMSICRVGMELIATAVKTGTGELKVIAWRVTASGEISRQASESGGDVSRIATAESFPLQITDDGEETLGYGQLTTGVRDKAGNLKLVHWALETKGKTITRLADAQAGAVDDIALCPLPPRTLISAVRDGSGDLKLISWALNDAGLAIDRWDSKGAGQVNEIAICPSGIDLFATAVRTGQGELKVIVWRSLAGGAEIVRITDATAGAATRISVCQAATGLLATAVKDGSGNLKVIAWKLS